MRLCRCGAFWSFQVAVLVRAVGMVALGVGWMLGGTALCAVRAHADGGERGGPTASTAGPTSSTATTRVQVHGARATRRQTLLELLPRSVPTVYSAAERAELQRRIANLELFDSVVVAQEGATLSITVREKWTLVPEVDFATGTTLSDTYLLLGLTEYNFLGTGSAAGANVYYEGRGPGFYAAYKEHVYRRQRWALAGEASYDRATLRFGEGQSWSVATALVYLWTTSPPLVWDPLRLELGLFYFFQTNHELQGDVRPRNGHTAGGSAQLTWDAYRFHDLVPRGWVAAVSISPALFFPKAGGAQDRYEANLTLKAAWPLAEQTVVTTQFRGALKARGSPNHRLVVGSVEGVRGLEDARYFNWAQVVVNLELRQALRLYERWYLQGVLFSDFAAFDRLDAAAHRSLAMSALSVGAGLRLVPTWLSGLLLRLDGALLLRPKRLLFYQIGVRQYF